jgi:hypothetical protein
MLRAAQVEVFLTAGSHRTGLGGEYLVVGRFHSSCARSTENGGANSERSR